ncbi:MAG: hypothetical protein Fur0020_10540 [Thermodesulfovibrionia bacterium]
MDTPRARYIPLRDNDIKDVIKFIKENTSEGEYIYSGLKDHDALLFNNALVYFLSERRCATRYHEMNPGFTTLPDVQREIIEELKDKKVRLMVLVSGLWNAPDSETHKQDLDILDNYIRDNFELRGAIGEYEIWMRRANE